MIKLKEGASKSNGPQFEISNYQDLSISRKILWMLNVDTFCCEKWVNANNHKYWITTFSRFSLTFMRDDWIWFKKGKVRSVVIIIIAYCNPYLDQRETWSDPKRWRLRSFHWTDTRTNKNLHFLSSWRSHKVFGHIKPSLRNWPLGQTQVYILLFDIEEVGLR